MGLVWTAGANQATVLELNRDVTVQGVPVTAGRWSVWFVVREQEPWELVLDPRPDLWHTAHPARSDNQIRVTVQPDSTQHTEALTWSFPDVRRDGATLAMTWGTLQVRLDIGVAPTVRRVVSAGEAEPLLGSWKLERRQGPDTGLVRDLEITLAQDGSLHALIAATRERAQREWVLLPRPNGIFAIALVEDGEERSTGALLEADSEAGPAAGFVVRDDDETILYIARRAN